MSAVAWAALPIAVALVVAAAAARAVLVSTIDDARVRRAAQDHLEPLGAWALLAVGVFLLAKVAAGEAGLGPLALAAGLAAAALWLPRTEPEPGVVATADAPASAAPMADDPAEGSVPAGSLWRDAPPPQRPRRTLWSGHAPDG